MDKKYLAQIIATDNEGLQMISACTAGAKVKVADIKYLASNKVFLLSIERTKIETDQEDKKINSVCRFDCVDKVKSKNIDQKNDDLAFESYLTPDDELKEGEPRLLTVDNRLVLPVNKNTHVLVTAGDVLHSFAMPSLGVKKDAVPGRLNETWMRIDRPGIYRGQCSEIGGTGHGYMPVVIEAVSEEEFAAWVNEAKNEFAELNNRTIALSK